MLEAILDMAEQTQRFSYGTAVNQHATPSTQGAQAWTNQMVGEGTIPCLYNYSTYVPSTTTGKEISTSGN